MGLFVALETRPGGMALPDRMPESQTARDWTSHGAGLQAVRLIFRELPVVLPVACPPTRQCLQTLLRGIAT
ncbi:hypothetical protein AVM02_09910 [Brucella anthropi]